MLDQNTDRMWFVIGAVIVGAAIIFIANGTMPDIFASVAETFQGSSSEATEEIADMSKTVEVYSRDRYTYAGKGEVYGWTIGSKSDSIIQKNVKVEPNTWYRLTYEKVGKSPDLMVLTASDSELTRNSHNSLYSSTHRLRQLFSTDDWYKVEMDGEDRTHNISRYNYLEGPVDYTFRTSDDEIYVHLTSGNITPVDMHEEFVFHFDNIKLETIF